MGRGNIVDPSDPDGEGGIIGPTDDLPTIIINKEGTLADHLTDEEEKELYNYIREMFPNASHESIEKELKLLMILEFLLIYSTQKSKIQINYTFIIKLL